MAKQVFLVETLYIALSSYQNMHNKGSPFSNEVHILINHIKNFIQQAVK